MEGIARKQAPAECTQLLLCNRDLWTFASESLFRTVIPFQL